MEANDATQRTMGSKEKLAAPVKDQKAERAGKEEGNDDGASVATTSDDSAASASGIQAAHKKINTGMGVLINCGGVCCRPQCPCTNFPEKLSRRKDTYT